MGKYFASIQFVIEVDNEEDAREIQERARSEVAKVEFVVEAHADEHPEFDEFGHAG